MYSLLLEHWNNTYFFLLWKTSHQTMNIVLHVRDLRSAWETFGVHHSYVAMLLHEYLSILLAAVSVPLIHKAMFVTFLMMWSGDSTDAASTSDSTRVWLNECPVHPHAMCSQQIERTLNQPTQLEADTLKLNHHVVGTGCNGEYTRLPQYPLPHLSVHLFPNPLTNSSGCCCSGLLDIRHQQKSSIAISSTGDVKYVFIT